MLRAEGPLPPKSLTRGRPRGTSDHLPAGVATEAEVAWAAGVFEGEGSFVLSRDGYLRLRIGMTDEDILRRLRDILGGHVYGPYQYDTKDGVRRKPAWHWSAQSVNDVERIVCSIEPWLGERRRARLNELMAASNSQRGG